VRELRDELERMAQLAKISLAREGSDEDRKEWFSEQVRLSVASRVNPEGVSTYQAAARFDLNWYGLARYWRRRGV
jgi:hypothetical protein